MMMFLFLNAYEPNQFRDIIMQVFVCASNQALNTDIFRFK